jgi:lycopene elongase/hydratase (flavuxanthin-forming)
MVGDLWRASRPFSWINTTLPFLALAWAVHRGIDLSIALGVLYFLAPYNLLLYGVNDLYDYESDRLNPRKGGAIEGGLMSPKRTRVLWTAIALTNLPLLIALGILAGRPVTVVLAITVAAALAYSVPPVRTKVVPGLDSITSSLHFVLPCICGGLVAGASLPSLPWRVLTAFFLWGVASQALGAIQDERYDRVAGIGSIAVSLGALRTALFSALCYALALALIGSLGAVVPAFALLPYVLLAASCLSGDPERQARNAWHGFLGMNLLAGFIITQVLLRAWGADSVSLLALLAWGSAAGVLALLANVLANQRAMKRRAALPGPEPAVSVVVPARDEGSTIGACLESVRSQQYGGPVQIVVVDDGSADGTAEVAARYLCSGDRLLHPPAAPGWTGKCRAAQAGADAADGQVLLFLDADTTLQPTALRTLTAELAEQGGGMLSLLTRYRMESTVERALMPAFAQTLLCFLPITLMNGTRKSPSLAYGYGPCLTVSRADYVASGGHAAVRASVRDELDLARAVSRSGYPVRLLHGADLSATRHYADLDEIAAAWRRIYYAYSGHSLALSLFGMLGMATVFLLPLVTLVAAGIASDGRALTGSLLGCAALLVLRLTIALRQRQPLRTILWHPLTWAGTIAILGLSVADGLRGRSPRWRGRVVPVEAAP